MGGTVNRQVHLASYPRGRWPTPDDFELVQNRIPEPADGQVLVRNLWMSVDPYMRGRMTGIKSYAEPYRVGEVLFGGAIGRVVASRSPALATGDIVRSMLGWREFALGEEDAFEPVDPTQGPLSYFLGALGMPGLTAYVGLLDIALPHAGETVFVSAASGAVGSIVGQLARIKGCRVVGSAGSDTKVRFLLDELGFGAAFNHRAGDLEKSLSEAAPDGIDVYFDNVGGDHLRAALGAMRPFGRIVMCGAISQSNTAAPPPGPDNLALVVHRRLKMQGFIVFDHHDREPVFVEEVGRYIAEGRLRVPETVFEGIDQAVPAFLAMMRGEHVGKMLVNLVPEPSS